MDSEAKKAWEKGNVFNVTVCVTKGKNPELYQELVAASNRSGIARKLIEIALEVRNGKENAPSD